MTKCARCNEEFEQGWSKDQDGEAWEPEAFCSDDCVEQYYQHALAEDD